MHAVRSCARAPGPGPGPAVLSVVVQTNPTLLPTLTKETHLITSTVNKINYTNLLIYNIYKYIIVRLNTYRKDIQIK